MLAVIICFLASCSKGGEEITVEPKPDPNPMPEEIKAEITLDEGIESNGLSFDAAAGEKSVSFSTNVSWTLGMASTSSGVTWCRASVDSGIKGTNSVKFSVDENTDLEDRSVAVTIKAGSISKTFTITQKAANALLVTTTKYEVPQEGGQISVEVRYNYDYQIEISEDSKSWISESSSRALDTHRHLFDISACDAEEKRMGEIRIKSGNKEEIVSVYQGKSILLLSNNHIVVNEFGDTISVDLKSNCEFKVQIPDVDWIIDEASSRGMSSHTLKYIVKPNDTYDYRNGYIIFSDTEETVKDTLVVLQTLMRGIILTESEVAVKAEGEIIEVPFKTSIEVSTKIDVDWIKQVQAPASRHLSDRTFYFEISPNETVMPREAQILFLDYNLKNVKDTLTVYQGTMSSDVMQNVVGAWNMTSDNDCYLIFGNHRTGLSVNGKVLLPFSWTIDEQIMKLTYDESQEVQEWEIRSNEGNEMVLFNLNETNPDAANPVSLKRFEGDYLFTTLNDSLFDYRSQHVDFYTYSNKDYEIKTSTTAIWIAIQTIDDNKNLRRLMLYENREENELHETIVVKQKDGELQKPVSIRQLQKDKFCVLDNEFNIPAEGETIKVKLMASVGYSYYIPTEFDWIKDNNPARSSEEQELSFIIKENDSYEDRTGYIIFNEEGVESNDTVYIYQAQNNALLISQSSYDVTSDGGIIEVKLSANVDFEVSIDVNWISQVEARGLTEHTLYFNVAENVELDARSANIVLVNNETQLSETITINQDALLKGSYENGVVTVYKAGTLSHFLGDDYLDITYLKIVGPINGEDVYFLHRMLGRNNYDEYDWGKLSSLDLSEALIVEGGKDYPPFIYTSDNVISYNMFSRCANLKKIILPDNITAIHMDAFEFCKALTSVNIPYGVEMIGNGAFEGCHVLEDIHIPNTVTTIGDFAFRYCDALTSVSIPDGVVSLGLSVFEHCDALISATIGDGVTSIGSYAFMNCPALKTVKIGNGVTLIDVRAFSFCETLTSVSIGTSVASIGDYAFGDCPSIKEFYCHATVPPTLVDKYTEAFSSTYNRSTNLYVPSGSVDDYENSPWSDYFRSIVGID